jgi:hypothetical protein
MGKICSKQVKDTPIQSNNKSQEIYISDYIQNLLKQPSVNITLLPDSIESKLYEKLFIMGFEHLKQFLLTFKIEFLHYELRLELTEKKMEPQNLTNETYDETDRKTMMV